jgi:uncharacterized protein (DUF433 family)
MTYTCINIQGNLISEEILKKIEAVEISGQNPKDFGFDSGVNLRNEIEYAWSRIKLDWKHYSERSQNLPATDPYGTTLSRKWMEGFFSSIGFELSRRKIALEGDNQRHYAISHTAENLDNLPIHIVGFTEPNHQEKNTLDVKTSGGTTRFSPHGTMQEYLNVTEHLYGVATNGLYLRLIRDSGRLVKLTYVEFDLKRLLDEDKYSEFTLLYRFLHASRFPRTKQEVDECLLEKYYRDSIETGNRIRDGLSLAVKESLIALGKGFLQHEHNSILRDKLIAIQLSDKDFYRQLLRLIYRFLFLMVTEERDLVYDSEDRSEDTLRKKRIYLQFYSIARLRKLSQNRYVYESQYNDLWQGLIQTFQLYEEGGNGTKLGIQPLAGDLFNSNAIADLENCLISNQLLLECIRNLNEFTDANKNLVSINYRSLDVEELGSVYEGLLELHPVIEHIETHSPANINFIFHEGTDRKTTGSYYTRPDLVNELIKSALIPVIENRLKEFAGKKQEKEDALLKLKVCDAAAGSGHMLLAAARTIAWYLAKVRSGEENPPPSIFRSCLREVIQHCIYGVDMNPDAVELCKLALWLESHNSGKPLSFLDHKIRNGNSLVGVTDLNVLTKGIPDEAFNPVTGDDKEVCKELKKANAAFNKTKQASLFTRESITDDTHRFSDEYHEVENIKQDDVVSVKKAKTKFEELRNNAKWYKDWRACNLWTAAFFYTYTEENKSAATSNERLQSFLQNPAAAYGPMIGKANALSEEHKFFHWPLEFPDVFDQGGFDVMLGNPPWERIKLQEQEFFATRDSHVANAANSSSRKKIIGELKQANPVLFKEYQSAVHIADATGKFLRESGRCKFTAIGDINTYSIFAELTSSLIRNIGRVGIIVPTGIATDDNNKVFFGAMIENNRVVSLFDFENREAIFPGVHRMYKFCLLTLSGYDLGSYKTQFGFFLSKIEQLQDKLRVFSLNKKDFIRLNPNTKTCPIFRTSNDATLTATIYKRVPILVNETTDENPWGISFMRMFDMSNDSSLFRTKEQNEEDGAVLKGNNFIKGSSKMLPLYEGKMCLHYNYRACKTYFNANNRIRPIQQEETSLAELKDSSYVSLPIYWVNEAHVMNKIPRTSFLIGFRKVTGPSNERTIITSIFPYSAAGDSLQLVTFKNDLPKILVTCFCVNFSSLVLDYIAKQKVGGINLNYFYVQQFPFLKPDSYSKIVKDEIARNAIELFYNSWDIKPYADDIWREADDALKNSIQEQWDANKTATGGHEWNPPEWCEIDAKGCPLPPLKWDEERRAFLKAELDAIYAKLYGLTTEELRYILDPEDVYGADFPGETFRVLKDKETRLYGEYRTKRLVLEAWDRLHEKPINSLVLAPSLEPMKEFSLHEGIYSIRDVVQITKLSADKVRRWFKDLSQEQYEGLSGEQTNEVNNLRISFHGLIELVVIDTLRENKFSLKSILVARKDLQQKTSKIYPFATNNVKDNLKIAGKSLVFRFSSGDVTLNGSGQYNLSIIETFFKNIEFDTEGLARSLFPVTTSKLIVIDPKQGGGKAIVNGKGVWAETIAMSYNGPDSVNMLKGQYDITEEEISAALEYCN